jgi:ABC-type nitrate/sulfonate/bicarbonate transport system substrate-binding protein
MSSAVLEQTRPTVVSRPAVTEAHYTICPVLVASNIAVEFGWLDEEFKRVGAKATYLRSLPDNAGWIPHYTHGLPHLFRDGGAIPTILAKADLVDTTLIGLTWTQVGGHILARSDSGIRRVAQLAGRKIGLTRSLNGNKVDFSRATAHRGAIVALELAGLSDKDVEWIDLHEADDPHYAPAQKPAELWAQSRAYHTEEKDVTALRDRQVDAIYSNPGRSETLVNSGEFTVIEDLSRYPDWTAQLANGPYTTAVNTAFAQEHPEVIVAFLRAAIRAGRWINEHRAAAAQIFTRVTFYRNPRLVESLIRDFDFVPQLSPRNLAATELQKKFLRDYGYVQKDFDVKQWANPQFIDEAHRTL